MFCMKSYDASYTALFRVVSLSRSRMCVKTEDERDETIAVRMYLQLWYLIFSIKCGHTFVFSINLNHKYRKRK